MKQKFLDLYEKLKENSVVSIPGINARVASFSPEAMTLLIYPAIEDNDRYLKIENTKFDVDLLKEIYKIKKKYSGGDFTRIFLFGEYIKVAFECIVKAQYVYEDEYNPVIITAEEIQFTIKSDLAKVQEIIKKFPAFALYVSYDGIVCYLNQLSKNDVDLSKVSTYRYSKSFYSSIEDPYLFMILLKYKGPIHFELTFLRALDFLDKKHQEEFFANANSKFVLTYLQEFSTINGQEMNGLLHVIKSLLNNFDINMLANYSFDEIDEKFYDLIQQFKKADNQ